MRGITDLIPHAEQQPFLLCPRRRHPVDEVCDLRGELELAFVAKDVSHCPPPAFDFLSL